MTGKTRSKREVIKDKLFAFLRATSLTHGLDRDHLYLGHSYGRNFLFLGWSHQPFEEAIKAVHEARPNVSEKTIGRVLRQAMVKLFHQHNIREDADPEADAPVLDSILETLDPLAVNKEITSFLDLLRSHIKMWTAFVFLEGIELKGLRELPLGVATLYPRNRGPLHDALEEVKTIEGLDYIPQYVERFAGHCCCYLTIDIEGDSHFASQQALHQAQDVVSILNLYIVSSRHRVSSYERIGVLGQLTTTRHQFVLKRTPPIGEDTPSPGYFFFVQPPPARRHEIDSAQVQRWREYGLDKVLECVGLPDIAPGSVESRIRSATTWYGRAMNAHAQDEQFLDLTIALESLLGAGKDASITQRLADVTSTLIGTDFQSREHIAERTRELYKARSGIVHEGVPISQVHLFALNEIVAKTILAFVRREVPER